MHKDYEASYFLILFEYNCGAFVKKIAKAQVQKKDLKIVILALSGWIAKSLTDVFTPKLRPDHLCDQRSDFTWILNTLWSNMQICLKKKEFCSRYLTSSGSFCSCKIISAFTVLGLTFNKVNTSTCLFC